MFIAGKSKPLPAIIDIQTVKLGFWFNKPIFKKILKLGFSDHKILARGHADHRDR
jgi:hypothetical protein